MDASFSCGLWPPKLCSLLIGGLKKPISKWGPQTFPTSLVDLVLIGGQLEDVSNFSQLSHLLPSSLTSLSISGFEKVESVSMGLQHLTSLQHLLISNCPKTIDLPEMLLPSLLSLRIYECPNLKESGYHFNLKTSASRNQHVLDFFICFSTSRKIKLQRVIHMVFFTANELYFKHFHFICISLFDKQSKLYFHKEGQ
ncbi:hypothetical protein L1887_32598 [Cichorium endivia]|nr:hypothetical protein L1887_32598 [Cichorium endivia]